MIYIYIYIHTYHSESCHLNINIVLHLSLDLGDFLHIYEEIEEIVVDKINELRYVSELVLDIPLQTLLTV